MKEICKNCAAWEAPGQVFTAQAIIEGKPVTRKLHRCKRFPPQVFWHLPAADVASTWPLTGADEGCLSFMVKPKKPKVKRSTKK